jgi:hypothetical protein
MTAYVQCDVNHIFPERLAGLAGGRAEVVRKGLETG